MERPVLARRRPAAAAWLRRVGRLGAPEQRQDRADYAEGRPRRACAEAV